jgi:FkbM family methyltransferase
MVSLRRLKQASLAIGLYRPARFLKNHLLDRGRLAKLRDDVEFYRRLLDPPCLCFDIGANIGEKTEALLQAGATVVAFEPQADCMRELRARCGGSPRLKTRRAAVGAQVGEMPLFVHEDRSRTSLSNIDIWRGEVESTVTVPVTTLDEAIAEFGTPKFCKIDVQLWELEVLKGLTRPVPMVSFEYHLDIDGGAERTRTCLDQLARLGRLSINITPAEDLTFFLDDWCTPAEFLQRFPAAFQDREGFVYGDIFVKIA